MIRTTRRSRAAAIVTLILAAGVSALGDGAAQTTAAPQNPVQRPPIFRAGSNFVLVDAYPRRDGHVVPDLTAADFDVLEDGKPQKVEWFEFVRVTGNMTDEARRDPRSKEEGDQLAADPRRRVFVVYLDTYFTSPEAAKGLRVPLDNFLTRAMGPLDLFGIASPTMAASDVVFGQRVETTEEMLAKYWTWARGATPRETAPEAFIDKCFNSRTGYPSVDLGIVNELIRLWRMDQMFDSLNDLMTRLGDLRDERKNLLLFTDGWSPGGPELSLQQYVWGHPPPRIGTGTGGQMRPDPANANSPEYARCDQELLRLATIDFTRRYRELPPAAVRANVAFYPVNRWGANPGNMAQFDDSPSGLLRRLAEDTGGTSVIGTTDTETEAALGRIADDLSAFYLLGYYSTNAAFDGRFRKIDVRVKQPQVTVTARKGYAAPTEASMRALSAPRDAPAGPSPVDRALMSLATLQSSAELVGYAVSRPGPGADLAIVAELSAAQAGDPRWASGADVQAVVTGSTGETVGTGRGRIETGARSAFVSVPLTASAAGPWRVVLRAKSDGGEVRADAEVPAPDAGPVSGPLVSRASGGLRAVLRPAADFLFQRSERLHAEWIITQPLEARQARLLDRTGTPIAVEVPLTEKTDGGRSMLVAELALAPLAPGDYVLELVAGHGGVTTRKVFALRVTR